MSKILIGQAAIVCQLCEKNGRIKWKCIDCNLFLCSDCKDYTHSKIRVGIEHKIIDLKDITEQDNLVSFGNIKCENHDGHLYCLVCMECGVLVCPVCITQMHSNHDFEQIKPGYEMAVKQSKNIQKKLDYKLKQLSTIVSKLENVKSDERSKYDKCRRDMDETKQTIHELIDQYYENLHKDLESTWQKINTVVDREHYRICKLQKEIEKKSSELDNLVISNDVFNLFRKINDIEEDTIIFMELNSSSDSYQTIPTFLSGKLNSYDHEFIFGKLQYSLLSSLPSIAFEKISLEIKNHYTAKSPEIKALSKIVGTDTDNTLWVKIAPSGNVRKIRLVDESIDDIQSVNMNGSDIARTMMGDLLVAEKQCNQLKMIQEKERQLTETDFTTSPTLRPTAVQVVATKIIIGVVEDSAFDSRKSGKILIMENNGKLLKTYELDYHNKPLLTFPYRIETNSIDDIIVIDSLSKRGHGRVIVLGRQHEKAIFIGTRRENTDCELKPFGIAITKLDNILVANKSANNILVLNKNAEHIDTINLHEMGIILPISLYVKNNNTIYIGCEKVKGSVEMAKIHVGKISGC